MIFKSPKDYKVYKYEREKRYKDRVPFVQEILYPVINGESFIDEVKKTRKTFISTVDINEFGIGIRSKKQLSVGDFLNLCIKFDKLPIIETISRVKWVGADDDSYLAGCEFCSIKNEDRQYIKEYMNSYK